MSKSRERGKKESEDEKFFAELDAMWEEFSDSNAWDLSKKGNRWRLWDGVTLTVFKKGQRYRWCIADGTDVTYSDGGYETEEEAISDLFDELVW